MQVEGELVVEVLVEEVEQEVQEGARRSPLSSAAATLGKRAAVTQDPAPRPVKGPGADLGPSSCRQPNGARRSRSQRAAPLASRHAHLAGRSARAKTA